MDHLIGEFWILNSNAEQKKNVFFSTIFTRVNAADATAAALYGVVILNILFHHFF